MNKNLACQTNSIPCDTRRDSSDNTCEHYPAHIINGHVFTESEIAAYALAHPLPPTKVFKAQLRAAMLQEIMPGAIPSQRTLDCVCRQADIADRLEAMNRDPWGELR